MSKGKRKAIRALKEKGFNYHCHTPLSEKLGWLVGGGAVSAFIIWMMWSNEFAMEKDFILRILMSCLFPIAFAFLGGISYEVIVTDHLVKYKKSLWGISLEKKVIKASDVTLISHKLQTSVGYNRASSAWWWHIEHGTTTSFPDLTNINSAMSAFALLNGISRKHT